MKHDDLSISEKLYIEEHSTEKDWLDIYTLHSQTGIDYEKISDYRRCLIGIAKANKLLDKDFLNVMKRDQKTDQQVQSHVTTIETVLPKETVNENQATTEPEQKIAKIEGLLSVLESELADMRGILRGEIKY